MSITAELAPDTNRPQRPEMPPVDHMMERVRDTYIWLQNRESTMSDNYDLLESLPGAESLDEDMPKPALTICMPVAITREGADTIAKALDSISSAQEKFDQPIDVVIWANAKYEDDGSDEEAVSMEASGQYADLRAMLADREDEGLNIRTALQIRPKSQASIAQIRNNYMEAVALDAQLRDLGYEHPVMWLDADLVDVSDKTFEHVVRGVRNFEGAFVHPMTHYGIDWADGKPLSETNAATKVVAIDEIMRRQTDSNDIRDNGNTLGGDAYHEENGLAFAIGTYLSIGGLTRAGTDEVASLVNSFNLLNRSPREYYAERLGVSEAEVSEYIKAFPTEKITQSFKNVPPDVVYLPKCYTTMAARKQLRRVQGEGPEGLKNIWTNNYRGLYVDEKDAAVPQTEDQITEGAHAYIEKQAKSRPLTDAQKATIGRLVTRYFGDTPEQQPKK